MRKPDADEELQVNHYAPRDIHRDSHTVEDCMLHLLKKLKTNERLSFTETFSEAPTKEEVVTLFLAMLELLKLGQMHIDQSETYGDIILLPGQAEATIEGDLTDYE
ncbi:MAG: segregation/condensation protein A [Clostridia bacterium]|nr:segregation/condensation protein A [Clostridia bacterium]